MPSSLILAAIYGSEFAAAAELGAFGFAAASFGIRLVTTLVVSSIIAKRAGQDAGNGTGTQQLGNRVQLPPSTDNKIGVVYGTALMKPIIIDAKISDDNQTMWYVLVFSEAMETDSIGTFSFGDIYWGDKKLTFDDTDQTKVISWTGSDGVVDTKVADKIHFYLYRDGSTNPVNTSLNAWEVLQDSTILEANRWTTANKMSKLVFGIVKVNYDQASGVTGLAEVTAAINNTLTKPGAVIKDYLTNRRYGAGLDVSRVNLDSLTALDTYADQTISYTPSGGGAAQTAPRFRINGPVDTTKNFLNNTLDICDSCDSWLAWNEILNKWTVVINRSVFDLDPTGAGIRRITADQIIGGVDIHPMDLNTVYNSVEVQFPNTKIKDQPGYYKLDISSFPHVNRSPNEPDNKLSVSLPYTNNIVEAQYVASRRLLQSREDLSITFTMDHSGIQIDAGDIIGITHERYGWTGSQFVRGKLFRVNRVQESKDDAGSMFAQITATEYNDQVYADNNITLQDFTPDLNTGITDPGVILTPDPPTISNINYSQAVPAFTVNAMVPSVGGVAAIEFWYSSTTPELGLTNYKLYSTEISQSGTLFTNGATVSVDVTGLVTGTYYWRVRAVGTRTKTPFSDPSGTLNWTPNPLGTIVGQNFEGHFVPTTLNIRQDTSGTIYYSSVTPVLYGQSGGGVIAYSTATYDTHPAFGNNSWRIGATTSTGVQGIQTTNVVINLSQITNVSGHAQFASPTSMSSRTAQMIVPIRYKNNLGQIFQAIPATQQFQITSDGINGYTGSTGTSGTGTNGINGFVNFAYVPISINPISATNDQLTAAWVAQFNRDPVYNDNGTFWGPTAHKNFSYYGTSTQWVAASLFIDGDLVSTGTIRGAALVADAIYGKTFQSNNGYVGSYASPGTWIDGNNGNARFAGTMNIGNSLTIGNSATIGTNLAIGANAIIGDNLRVGNAVTIGNNLNVGGNAYIGNNLTVAGLITQGALNAGVISSSTFTTDVHQAIYATQGGGTQLGTAHVPSSNSWVGAATSPWGQYDWHYTSGLEYGFWMNIGYSDNLDSYGGVTVNVQWSGNLVYSGALTGYGGPGFNIFMNYNTNGGSNVHIFVPAAGNPLPSGANSTGSIVDNQNPHWPSLTGSYNGSYIVTAQFIIPNGASGVVIGVGFMNGTGSNNQGTFNITGNSWSITRA
jgi:hypothetical protein